MINWKVRLKNKVFWVTVIPAFLVLIQTVFAVFGVELDLSVFGDKLIAVVEALFMFLAILGIVADPTTKGVGDGELGLTYEEPK
jgi:phi LC3 family holin